MSESIQSLQTRGMTGPLMDIRNPLRATSAPSRPARQVLILRDVRLPKGESFTLSLALAADLVAHGVAAWTTEADAGQAVRRVLMLSDVDLQRGGILSIDKHLGAELVQLRSAAWATEG